jgi:hypothetical protein
VQIYAIQTSLLFVEPIVDGRFLETPEWLLTLRNVTRMVHGVRISNAILNDHVLKNTFLITIPSVQKIKIKQLRSLVRGKSQSANVFYTRNLSSAHLTETYIHIYIMRYAMILTKQVRHNDYLRIKSLCEKEICLRRMRFLDDHTILNGRK